MPKPDGYIRGCIDLRYLNAVSTFDADPMLWIETLLHQMGERHYLSTLDLAKGCWQIPKSL